MELKIFSVRDVPLSLRTYKKLKLAILFTVVFCSIQMLFWWQATRQISLGIRELTEYTANVRTSKSAANLPREGFLFCWALTSPKYHSTRAIAINQTWLTKCDHGQLFTSEAMDNESMPFSTVFNNLPDCYDNLFIKTPLAFYYISEVMHVNFDWYLKTDDDTYIIVENLVNYLRRFDPNKPHFFGFRLKPFLPNGYNSGAAYVLSRAAMKRYVDLVQNNSSACIAPGPEDLEIARCLAMDGILPEDTREADGRQRFNAFRPDEIFHGTIKEHWLKDPIIRGFGAFSQEAISFHHLTVEEIRYTHALLYYVGSPKSQDQPVNIAKTVADGR